MRSPWSLGVLALYALTVGAVVALFASALVPSLYLFGPVPVVVLVPFYAFLALDWVGLDARTLSPLVVVATAVGPFVAVGAYASTGRPLPVDYAVAVQQAAASVLALAALVAVALPLVVRWYAWRQFEDATASTSADATAADRADATASEAGAARAVPDELDVQGPDRLAVRGLAVDAPAVYLVDDGFDAVVGVTAGARGALDARERDAVLAREVTRTVDGAAVPAFWASALALAVGRVVRPVSTPRYDSRAGDKVRLPYRFVAPLKIVAAVLLLFVGYVVAMAALSAIVHVHPVLLALGYALGTVGAAFAVVRAASWLARRASSEYVFAADEHGAILVDDPDALASALRTLETARDADGTRAVGVEDTAGGDDYVLEDERDVLAALADCPTDRVPVEDRISALEALGDRLADSPGPARRDVTTADARL